MKILKTLRNIAFVSLLALASPANLFADPGDSGAAYAGWYACSEFHHSSIWVQGTMIYGGWSAEECEDWENDSCTGGSHEWFWTEGYTACWEDCDAAGRSVVDFHTEWCAAYCVCGS